MKYNNATDSVLKPSYFVIAQQLSQRSPTLSESCPFLRENFKVPGKELLLTKHWKYNKKSFLS